MPTPIEVDDETVDCSDGCPFVIYKEDWEYHLGWHAEVDSNE